jgi:hypothetical protein
MSNKCCICGTVLNCGKYLDKIFSNMEELGKLFDDYRIILYYDKSNDNTLNKLKSYQAINDKFIFYVNQSKMLKYRTHRLALGRNFCISHMKENYSDYEFFIVMDCDDICARDMNINNLTTYLYRDTWDCLSFQHPTGYYDTWALSIRPYIISYHNLSDHRLGFKYITNIIDKRKETNSEILIPCLSAFNGIAIYRTHKFINCLYDGRFRLDYIPQNLINENIKYTGKFILNKDNTNEDCEHRHFHFQAVFQNNARIRISPLCLFV